MTKKVKIPKPTKCYGYTGVWHDGNVGWFGPSHLGGTRKYPDNPDLNAPQLKDERLFLCEITVKPLVDKRGRPITKIVKQRERG